MAGEAPANTTAMMPEKFSAVEVLAKMAALNNPGWEAELDSPSLDLLALVIS